MSGTPLTDAINALTTYANEITGKSDTTLSDAVGSLVDGYGGGGFDVNSIAENIAPNGNIILDTATVIEEYALNRKRGITGIIAPYVTRIKQYAFEYCGESSGGTITSTSFPSLTTIDSNAFRTSRFTSIEITASTDLLKNTRPFGDNSALRTALFPNQIGMVGNMCFYSCLSLDVLDIGFATSISTNAFNGCPLTALIIRSTSVCSLSDINAFNNSSFKSGGTGGTLYVPQSLISSYQSASNWSTILGYPNNSIKKIEGSIYEI